jgi:beta-glucosidase
MIEDVTQKDIIVKKEVYDYKNPDLDVDTRIADLLQRMTIEEKVSQMLCVWEQRKSLLIDEKGYPEYDKFARHLKHGVGQVARISDTNGIVNPREIAEITNAIQTYFVEQTRLGIPVIFHEECLHGLAAKDVTSYPQPIGLASTFNPHLIEDIYAAVAEDARSCGAHQALAPVLDVARDPRWGRVEETFGEDPYLVAHMGLAAVRGFQGDADFNDKKKVIATLKHFAAHGQPESGTNCAPVNVSERLLRDTFLYPFKEAIDKGNAMSVMASYNEIDGVSSHANTWLLRTVLRDEWGFKGTVVSDYFAVTELHIREEAISHCMARDKSEAALLAVKAGVNIELPDRDCYPNLVQLVQDGILNESEIDELVSTLLKQKFLLGLFDDPYVNIDKIDIDSKLKQDKKVALQAARETITLLKNDNNLLPLNIKQGSSIAVIGPNADRELIGGYSGIPRTISTVLQGVKNKVGNKYEVLYSEGCKITVGGSWNDDEVIFPDPKDDEIAIKEAVKVAKKSDFVILALGGNEQTSREAWDKGHMGDRADIDLVGRQNDLVKAILETGKKVVALLFNGRPLSFKYVSENVPAILECWYLGQESGNAVADVLFGDYNPSGKLPISFPRSVGHIPCYYNYKPSARRGYLDDDVSPLYPFGFGLSYTTFDFLNLHLEKSTIRSDESTRVFIDVVNTGSREGEDVVQLYIRDKFSSVTRPVKELKGFEKINLKPGEITRISLPITPDSLAFTNIDMKYTVEPGEFEIMVGNSSRDEDLQKVVLNVI